MDIPLWSFYVLACSLFQRLVLEEEYFLWYLPTIKNYLFIYLFYYKNTFASTVLSRLSTRPVCKWVDQIINAGPAYRRAIQLINAFRKTVQIVNATVITWYKTWTGTRLTKKETVFRHNSQIHRHHSYYFWYHEQVKIQSVDKLDGTDCQR